MKKLNANELRTVDGGYRLICGYCGKASGSVTSWGASWFFLKHKHFRSGGYAMYDRRYINASKYWS